MTASLHSFLADYFHRRKISDPDNFAGRAADTLARIESPSERNVNDALSRVSTQLFRQTAGLSKADLLKDLSARLVKNNSIWRPLLPQETDVCQVLFLAASPLTQDALGLDEERRAIEQKVRGTPEAARIEFVDKWAVRPDDLLQCVNETAPNIVHFSGHGGVDGIVLSEACFSESVMTSDVLIELLLQFRNRPTVVIMNACESDELAKCIVKKIDCVIGTIDEIADEDARNFAASFYRAVASGRSIRDAFKQGKLGIKLPGSAKSDVVHLRERVKGAADQVILSPLK